MVHGAFKIIIASSIAAGIVVLYFFMSSTAEVKTISVGGAQLRVEVVDTLRIQMKGLSGRDYLSQYSGMLFVYNDKKVRDFWMKDMNFPIDVMWISDNVVVGLQENVPFQSNEADVVRFKSSEPVNMVLEANAGWIQRNGIKIGDYVILDSSQD